MVRRYGRCWMYGPNYVKLSRVFAVQLFSVLFVHYAGPPPVRSDPRCSQIHAITASIRLAPRPHPCTATHPLLATQTSAVVTKTRLDYLHPHTRTMRQSTALPTNLCACSQRILGVAPLPLALDKTQQHTLLATQTSAVVTKTCMSRLSALAYPNDAPIHAALPTNLCACSQRILGVAPHPLALDKTRQHPLLATQTSTQCVLRPVLLMYP
jgi:hypothetical protein